MNNWANYTGPVGKTFTLPSETVPGMTLSIKELLARFVRGDNVTTFDPVYTDDPDIPDNLERMDPMERLDYARSLRQGISDAQQRNSVIAAKKAADEAAAKKAAKPAVSDPAYPAPGDSPVKDSPVPPKGSG